jgi:predicted phage tail protein
MIEYEIQGGKGGEEKPHTPVETPNNLLSVAYARVLVAVAEGELAGVPTDQDIFLDGTPLGNPDGSKNFGGVTWDWRSGTVDQTYIQGLPEIATEFNVNVELQSDTPWVRAVTKSELDAVRVTVQWPALYEQKTNGDTVGYTINYRIQLSTAGGPFVDYQTYQVSGKTNGGYERTHRVNLPPSATGWTIRVIKDTADSTSSAIQDTMNIKSYAEVSDFKQRYPNTALLFVQFDSRLFGGGAIPRISVKTKGRKVRVPSNYDPETRTYNGIWAGDFKFAWTDNPAWLYHDILTQDRFGLGNKVSLNMVDKFALYEVAQYCDVLVDDGTGSGSLQPRHTCNIYIQEKSDAWKVLRDFASIFNGMTYWNGTQFKAVADKQEPITNIPIFSRSNVINGKFDYDSADDKSIYTSALISFDDPEDHYNTKVEATFETSEILRFGSDRQTEISAIGCTNRGEAQRRGKYTLLTNLFDRKVTFRTGLMGMNEDVFPGKIIHVTDPLIGGKPFTGRLVVSAGRVLTLDRSVDAVPGDIMYVTKSTGVTEGRTITQVSDNIVTVSVAYTEQPLPNAVWYLESSTLKSQLYRVIKVSEPDPGMFEIQGVEYNESKYPAIDNGARLEPRPISVVPPNAQAAPIAVTVTSSTFVEQTMAITTMTASWDQVANAVSYEVQWRRGSADWVNLGVTGANEVDVKGIYAGDYLVRVRAINALGIKSVWRSSMLTTLVGKQGNPPAVTDLIASPLLFGIRLDWYLPEGAEDTLRTEIMYSETESFEQAIKLGDFAYPQTAHELHGLSAGKRFFFWCRLVDRTGNIGPWFPNEAGIGVLGISAINDNGQYNEYFAGLISDTALDNELYDRIELIDGNGPGSVNDRIDNAVEGLQDQIDNITDALVYDPTKTYTFQDIVRMGNKLYQAQGDVPVNTPPPNELYWKDVGVILEDANNLATRVDVVEVKVDEIDGVLTSTVTQIESLQAAYREDDGVGSQDDAIAGWNSRAQITTEREVRASADEAFARELVVYDARISDSNARVTDLTVVVATNEEATATRITNLSTTVDENTAAISSEQTARVDGDGALSTRIDTTQATVGENTAAIQETSTALVDLDGKVSASWTLKIEAQQNGQYVAAGIGLGIENGPAGLQSQFLVRADRFAVVDGTTTTTSAPFVVQGGQVFISQALIGNGWITNAMIGNVIQSNDFVNNTSGWQINKNGTFQMNGSNGSGRMNLTATYLKFYHPNGVLAIDLSL